ncbi:hypothetical protein ES332_A12G249800v1 [Gossypium tomentosum]|uniref:Plastocyanin-like domain-containing protein n=1 Tax=Gossypium tomentosum TaxID=34277 RepID=A0A5D2N143_GOSTO|nr:hypothetical protein ES332_A12G249800v1 [Gossypium tomentosum]
MALSKFLGLFHINIALLSSSYFLADPFVFYDFEVSYITASPLGVPQQVFARNNKFPSPTINSTTNNNVVINVRKKLDESLLLHWFGIQQRRSTNCPIPPKWNWIYQFQVNDQIGSFFYFPSLYFQRAASVRTLLSYRIYGHVLLFRVVLRKALDAGKDLGMPDGVLINGKGPYQYNDILVDVTLVPDGIDYETIDVHPAFQAPYNINYNVGQGRLTAFSHNLLLVKIDGSYMVQQNYTSLDIHNTSSDYYIVASARFVNKSQWKRVTGVAILRYSNSKGEAAGPLPDPAWNGSFRYGSINVAEIFVLKNKPPVTIDGKRRTTLSRISFVNPATPIRLAESRPLTGPPKTEISVINGTFRGFIEVILQNNDTKVQTYHLSGYAFFIVGKEFWSENSKGTYNKWDSIARSTTQVYLGEWIAILISLDNVRVWNLRTENLDSWYLGQETYIRVVNPKVSKKTELPMPDNILYCGAHSKKAEVCKKELPQDISFATSITTSSSKLFIAVLIVASALLFH